MKEYIVEVKDEVKRLFNVNENAFARNELIRCKDCKFYHKTVDDKFCGLGSVVAFDKHYCSMAERK